MWNLLKYRNKHLNLTLRSADFSTKVVERPGLWMSSTELEKIVSDIRAVIASIGIEPLEYGIASGKKEVLDRSVLTIIYDKKTNRACAFNSLSLLECQLRTKKISVVHLGLTVIDPSYRARGLSWYLYGMTTFLLFLKNYFRPLWISNVTQVPSVIGMVCESFGKIYPNPKAGSRRTYDHLILARQIMENYRHVFGVGPEAEFDEENFIIKNSYTGGSDSLKKTFAQAMKHRNDVFNQYARAMLDYDRGDDVLQLGVMDVPTYYHASVHSLSGESKLIYLYKMFFHVFEFSLVPVFQWFSTSMQVGVLRPRTRDPQ